MNGQRHTVSLLNRVKGPLLNALSRATQPFLSLPQLVVRSGHRVLVPFYHAVSDTPLPHLDPLYPVRSPAQFSRDLDFMLRYFKPVDLPELVSLCGRPLAGEPASRKKRQPPFDKPVFHVTIDDGLRSAGEQMAVILRAKGVPATLFVNSAFVGNRALMYRYTAALIVSHLRAPRTAAAQAALLGEGRAFVEQQHRAFANAESFRKTRHLEPWILAQGYEQRGLLEALAAHLGIDIPGFLERDRPYLTLAELRSLQRQGFHIGSHSIDHPWYQHISPDERLRQTLTSLQWVREHLPGSPDVFAFPFSDAGLPESLIQQGFAQGIALHVGGPGLRPSPSGLLSRVAMEKVRDEASSIIRRAYFAGWGKGLL
ncbi:MAG: polysaccharide deacetylase family protein [Bacteroidetes bacterium]|nr:polysaccharide deacetylase family protein [Bacteroidota bacterium]